MKKFLVIFCIMASGMIFGMDKEVVELPSPRSLKEKFSHCPHLADFVCHSRFAHRFGDKTVSVAGIEFAIKISVANYQNSIFTNGGTVYHLHSLEKEVKDIIFYQEA